MLLTLLCLTIKVRLYNNINITISKKMNQTEVIGVFQKAGGLNNESESNYKHAKFWWRAVKAGKILFAKDEEEKKKDVENVGGDKMEVKVDGMMEVKVDGLMKVEINGLVGLGLGVCFGMLVGIGLLLAFSGVNEI